MGPLLKLRQESSVMAFRDQFELHATSLKREERMMLTSIFLNGLKDEIQAELKMYDIDDLDELMDRALLIEEKNQALVGRHGSVKDRVENKDRSYHSKFRNTWNNSSEKKENSVPAKTEEKTGDGGRRRWLSQAELDERSKKGLCFKCGERWGKGHVCKMKHMRLMLCEGEGSEEEEEEEELVIEEVGEFKTLQLSLQSKRGLTSNKSFKVWVIIRGVKVMALIDCGATSNFISPQLIEKLMLEVLDTSIYIVEVGTG